MMNIKNFRQEIDTLDEILVQTLAKRFDLCKQIAIYKSQVGMPMMQPERVKEVKERCSRIGEKHGLDAEFTRRLYGLIINETCELEDRLMQSFKQENQKPTRSDSLSKPIFSSN